MHKDKGSVIVLLLKPINVFYAHHLYIRPTYLI